MGYFRGIEPQEEAMSNNEWTPERIAVLVALWAEELPTSEIGRRLGITKNAVIGKAHRLRLPKRRPSPKQDLEPASAKLDTYPAYAWLEEDLGRCSWPVGDPHEENFHFCGEPQVLGKPYCAKHCAVSYIKPVCIREVSLIE